MAETETRLRRWPHQPRWDRDETFKFRDETFAGLESWPRRWHARCHAVVSKLT